jgi:hypothetical protein
MMDQGRAVDGGHPGRGGEIFGLIIAVLDVVARVDLLEPDDVRAELEDHARHPVGVVAPVAALAAVDVVGGRDRPVHGRHAAVLPASPGARRWRRIVSSAALIASAIAVAPASRAEPIACAAA